jgi:dTDP-4-dehydrorhamnose 3,5-epimerase
MFARQMKQRLRSRLTPHDSSPGPISDDAAAFSKRPDAGRLPLGVHQRSLQTNQDRRGSLTEIFRASWETAVDAMQWNYVESEANVLRGVHVHVKHSDYLILLRGRASIGLRDLRRGSPTDGMTALLEMQGDELHSLTIPPGVAHGFYFHQRSTHVYAVSQYWESSDELGCYWADPALGINWPQAKPLISERDARLPWLGELVESLPLWQ